MINAAVDENKRKGGGLAGGSVGWWVGGCVGGQMVGRVVGGRVDGWGLVSWLEGVRVGGRTGRQAGFSGGPVGMRAARKQLSGQRLNRRSGT